MKKKNNIFVSVAIGLIAMLFVACGEPTVRFDRNLLVGYWQRLSTLTDGQDCYRYNADGTGVTWDTGDDMTEAEGQPFTWTLTGDELVLIHEGEMGAKIPKTYTLKELTSSRLSYVDAYKVSYTFMRGK
ncbi:MAG: hypothetical protein Q4D14_05125 [Bacteroidales bacterium]|nr:hypothetical protein [Bacteroidales bacterium]